MTDGVYDDYCLEYEGEVIIMTEHHRTVNPNMPLIMLFYIVETYKQLYMSSIFKEYAVKITPIKLVTVYNGERKWNTKDGYIRLSDNFVKETVGPNVFNLCVKVVDVNESNLGRFTEFYKFFSEEFILACKVNTVESFSMFRHNVINQYPWSEEYFDVYSREELYHMFTIEDRIREKEVIV